MKAAIYIRVSTDDQAREGFSIPAQVKSLREYCKKNDITIYSEYIDEGISGAKENRPQFKKMIKDGLNKKFDVILVHKFDRFARKVELSQRVKNQLKSANINVVSITEPIEDSPMGFFVGGLHDLLAEYYIKNLSQEVKKGQKEKVSQGFAINRLCYGYKNINGNVSIVEEQAKVVKMIFEMSAVGKGTTIIANWLNDHGIPTLTHGRWNNAHIRYMLKNDTYTGILKWSGKKHYGTTPEIISRELFDKVQNNLKTNKGIKRKSYFDKFLLLGIIKCGYCGSNMRISKMYSNGNRSTGKVYYMYTCSKARNDKKSCSFTKHFEHSILERDFLTTLKDIVYGINNDYEVYVPYLVEDVLRERKSKILNELERVKKAYLAEVFTLEEYALEKRRLEDELKLFDLEASQNNATLSKKSKKRIENLWHEFLNEPTIPGKKEKILSIFRGVKILEDCLKCEIYG